tara:strand:- start:3116 stop:3382 length:267 start_codon:yes stop_codon:yes gene_type:complete
MNIFTQTNKVTAQAIAVLAAFAMILSTLPVYFFVANAQQIPLDVPGCMDAGATNFDPRATIDDGSCVLDVVPVPVPAAPIQLQTTTIH